MLRATRRPASFALGAAEKYGWKRKTHCAAGANFSKHSSCFSSGRSPARAQALLLLLLLLTGSHPASAWPRWSWAAVQTPWIVMLGPPPAGGDPAKQPPTITTTFAAASYHSKKKKTQRISLHWRRTGCPRRAFGSWRGTCTGQAQTSARRGGWKRGNQLSSTDASC